MKLIDESTEMQAWVVMMEDSIKVGGSEGVSAGGN
jgi:hypothetical protein